MIISFYLFQTIPNYKTLVKMDILEVFAIFSKQVFEYETM